MLPTSRFLYNSNDFKDVAMNHLFDMQRIKESRRIDDENEDSDNEELKKLFEDEYFDLQQRMNEIIEMNEQMESKNYFENQTTLCGQYNYNIDANLISNLSDYLETHPFPKKIHICPFQVNTTGLKPFLQFFLRKYPSNHSTSPDKLTFITFEELKNFDNIVNKSYRILEVLFLSYMKVAYYQYKGFIENETGDEIFMFYDCTTTKIGVHCLHNQNDLWLVLIDEIINPGKVCEFEVDSLVTNLFLRNPQMIHLRDVNNKIIETPSVAYSFAQNEQIEFVSVFGVSRNTSPVDAFMGSYFYFTSYENAKKELMKETKKKNGIIRFALFMGNSKIPLHLKESDYDNSEKTQQLLLKDHTATTKEYNNVRSLLKISDRDGKWVENYDSVLISETLLDEEIEYREKFPYWVIKTYEQQVPLTYHIIKV
jgi:hypothetical protein